MGTLDGIEDRRNTDPLVLEMRALRQSLDRKHPENVNHLRMIEGKVDMVLRGFPNNDPEAHCRYHESVIEWRELRNKMVKESLIKMAGAGAIAGMGWLMYSIFQSIRIWLKT